MKKNKHGIPIYNQYELVDALKQNPQLDLSTTFCSDPESYNKTNKQLFMDWKELTDWDDSICISEYHKLNQTKWLTPEDYTTFDIEQWLLNQCQTDTQKDRVKQELVLYRKFQLIPLLRYLNYLMTVIRENKVVLGVGRGSSCASYCLFLMGIHRIDPIKYNLNIEEFLREK